MPADSELPITWRPLGPRVMGIALGLALVVIVVVAWFTFDEETRAKFTIFQKGTIIALGLLGFSAMYALVRSRAEAHADRLVVVNGYRRRELAWPEIIAVHLPPGAPWVTLDLADGETHAVMGIQGSDGARAREAARDLRRLVATLSGPE